MKNVTVVVVPLGRNVDSNHENMADHGICNHDQPSVWRSETMKNCDLTNDGNGCV